MKSYNNSYKKIAQVLAIVFVTGISFSCFKKVDNVAHTSPTYGLVMSPSSGPKNTIINISYPNINTPDFPALSSIVVKINGVTQTVVSTAKNQIQIKVTPGSGTGSVDVSLDGGATSTSAGNFTYVYTNYMITSLNTDQYGTDDGPIETATFDDFRGIAIDNNDAMWSAMYYNPLIRKTDLKNDLVTTMAGDGVAANACGAALPITCHDGVGAAAELGRALQIGVSPDGSKVYWLDRNDTTIRVMDVATKAVTHFTGKLGLFKTEGITVAQSGNVYVTGSFGTTASNVNSWIMKYNPAGALQWSVKSKNAGGNYDQDGDTSTAKFFLRGGIAVNKDETKLYFMQAIELGNPLSALVHMNVKEFDLTTGSITTFLSGTDLANVWAIALSNDGGMWFTNWGVGSVEYYNLGVMRTIINFGTDDVPYLTTDVADQTTATAYDPFGAQIENKTYTINNGGDLIFTDDGDGFNKIKRIHPVD
jgi:hypothetical protein